MKEDALEEFIHQHRSAFDDQEPSEKVWRNIEPTIPVSKKTTLWNSVIVWRAAAVIFMAITIYLLIPKNLQRQQNAQVALNEFKDVEAFYVEQISQKVDLIDEFNRNEGLNGFTHDFKQLEAMYFVLKDEMKTHPSQKVKEALILNLLVRIDLLNQQLHHLEKDEEKGHDEVKEKSNT